MKYVTIATDISSDHQHRITTWACYIRHHDGVIKHAGQFYQYYQNTALAETYALINALTIAKKVVPSWSLSKVIIYNEVEYALDPLKTKTGKIRQSDSKRAEAIMDIAIPILQEAVDWERRKIKAHYKHWKESDNPKKYAINRWCDVESRKLLRSIKKSKKRF